MNMALLGTILSLLYLAYVVVIVAYLFVENRRPENLISWLLVIVFLPGVGVVLYLLFGINWKTRHLLRHDPAELFRENLAPVIESQQRYTRRQLCAPDGEGVNDIFKTIGLLLASSRTVLTLKNRLRLYHTGDAHFADLCADLEQARKSIHMEYYIWRSDDLGELIKDILVRKARQGCEVRLIFDGVGSLGTISRRYRRELAAAGVEFCYFLDLGAPFAVLKANYCNHRKIAVIDGQVGYTGGMNIGEEYINGGPRFDAWVDTHLRIEGEGAQLLQALFLVDWYNSRPAENLLIDPRYFPRPADDLPRLPVQIACSGPDSQWNTVKQLYFSLITNANREIHIITPYLIPDASICHALVVAALSGVEVHLMTAGVPDKRIPFWIAQTYYEELLAAGVHIYQFRGGFVHGKVLVADRDLSSVGTCNMDIRSFSINYEVNAVLYDQGLAVELVERFESLLEQCHEVTLEEVRAWSFPRRLRNGVLRLFAPLM